MSILEKEEKLFKGWKGERDKFVSDGAVSACDYLTSCPKIAFILKEANSPGREFDLREFLRDGGRPATWNNVAIWVHGIRNLPSECPWFTYERQAEEMEALRKETLKSICVLNLKKTPGGSSSSRELGKVAKEDARYIRNQYAIYDPDITICGGNETGELFHCVVHPKINWRQTKRGIWWYPRKEGKIVVIYPHPEARVQNSLLLYGLLDALKEIKAGK